ncbi:aminotransferase class V-fold PLP-dependent enzyme [Hydrogenophaga sp.]|uniref:aminotransferase class V-fold PLP-dependent enzyme n=1 Tax=Hydrogenophaga sp. TaxID=1904254 RepID=UPI0027234ABA|nr:aminotransferase class V-fold PLP-dependent enzyme [Hydrogenophaga sp.]MDO9133792.1 aminotransferase class V-fold PLP-dependent enzyme [Hydrogenophaga sp.]MDO9604092.1 aminotransferase class V-fold PLP-dependent enzyme [Hydrogenophaga sp.]MDP2163483.1 aminotransferase class V-fold PLP-dependent enzyme [Hydrogenophaga sp.]MDP3476687.1 aminotransferase class V-fold PLP-dependent enzyme [Hydrogenophaga sp.]
MPGLLPHIDPDGLLEFSVVYTDRALNHMSKRFQGVMTDVSTMLKRVYGAHSAVLVPGSGTFGMESVARQFAHGKHVMVIRNGWFSYRWTQIFDMGSIPASHTVLKAHRTSEGSQAAWAPAPIEAVKAAIAAEKPALVFAPHVETSAGMILPDDYLIAVADAVHAVGGLFVLDCIASGAMWVDMQATGVDILISAPQKGWSSSPCCAMVMLSERARKAIDATQSTTFSMDLKKWLQIMETYEGGGHAYHTTLPTDALVRLHDTMKETEAYGYERVRQEQIALGRDVRNLLERHGFPSVSAPGFQAPGVVVSYTTDPDIQSSKKFLAAGLQTAAGVPLQCDEPADFRTFRIGLFGLDKWHDVPATLQHLERALAEVAPAALPA